MDVVDLVLRLVGAFYVFAAFVAARAALMSLLIDRAIAAIALKKPPRAEILKSYWLISASVLVMLGGAALLFLLDVAVWAFLVSSLGQAAYLFVVAPRYFDVEEPPDEVGRRQTTNAFVIYLVATAFVVWAYSDGRLSNVTEVSWLALAVPTALVLAHVVNILRNVAMSAGRSPFGAWDSGDEGESCEPSRPLNETKTVKVMTDYYTHPLWALDEDLYGDIPPEDMQLSPDLVRDLNAWAEAYDTSLDQEDPARSIWSEEQRRAHEAKARPLAMRLARERPDLVVYVMEPEVGVVQVHADDSSA